MELIDPLPFYHCVVGRPGRSANHYWSVLIAESNSGQRDRNTAEGAKQAAKKDPEKDREPTGRLQMGAALHSC